ncbi:Long-chain-fatty-acid--CoA ligase 5 [Clydaea vesicula]|uniref:Long-chain-fatty-acid--CoA ligase 5 n=1 Tax=Clydaea vesicula TaxID=447962 RepID=A0AAD5XZ57_9FUNG|nr:Long-chain-fatty-acid--CoA ligase 5 [Clydaea vesicula]
MMEFDTTSVALSAFICLSVIYLTVSSKEPDISPHTLVRQATVSPTRNKGESAIYRHPSTPFGTPLTASPDGDCKTVYDLFQKGLKISPNGRYLGTRVNDGPYVWQTYTKVSERIKNIGSGLVKKFNLKKDAMIGIFFKNTADWILLDHSSAHYSLITVPMYDTFDQDALSFIVNHTETTVVAVSLANLEKVFSIAGSSPNLKNIVLVDVEKVSTEISQRANAVNVNVYTLNEIETFGKENPQPVSPPASFDIFTICYTSGTTGNPKGVMITHKNVCSAIAGVLLRFPKDKPLCSTDVHLSYLPLSHMFERNVSLAMTFVGGEIGFSRGDILKLFDDIVELRPTVFPSVPRLLSRLYDKVMLGISTAGPVKKFLFNKAFNSKKALLEQGIVTRDTVWDKLVFSKIQARLGGRVRLMVMLNRTMEQHQLITGAAPISAEIITFLRIAIGVNVFEGYGQTETTAAGTLTNWGDYAFPMGSHVGVPFSSTEVKLIDVPSMNYYAEDTPNPRGEICFRGNLNMKGGDIGEVLPNGTLKIVDRVKNIFKLSQGEYVAPEKVEMKIKTPQVLQCFVYGDSLKSCVVAVVVPDPETIVAWAKEKGHTTSNVTEFCKNAELKKLLLKEITETGVQNGLHKFEIPRLIHLHADPFSVENEKSSKRTLSTAVK